MWHTHTMAPITMPCHHIANRYMRQCKHPRTVSNQLQLVVNPYAGYSNHAYEREGCI